MTPPAAASRHARPVDPPPAPAVAAVALAFLGGLALLWLALVVWGLGGLSSDGSGRAWALLPLAAGATSLIGGVWVLRRRGWWPLAVAGLLALAFVGLLAADSARYGEDLPVGMAVLVLAGPVLALALACTPRVRAWLTGPR
jgi:hypothetical protein